MNSTQLVNQSFKVVGRFAPTPTSQLHFGNLRTAIAAWLFARAKEGKFIIRIEDLDQVRVSGAGDITKKILRDLTELGIDWDDEVIWQSQRQQEYLKVIESLKDRIYPCFCTRREIAQSAQAPHGAYRLYPGTCRNLTKQQQEKLAKNRRPAWRIRTNVSKFSIYDRHAGKVTLPIDDFVLMRNDQVIAYNFAVVVDDLAAGINQVTRGDDLLFSAPRQAWLIKELGGEIPEYIHVSLVLNENNQRLAKRDGAVSLTDLKEAGYSTQQILLKLLGSLGQPPASSLTQARKQFVESTKLWQPVVFTL